MFGFELQISANLVQLSAISPTLSYSSFRHAAILPSSILHPPTSPHFSAFIPVQPCGGSPAPPLAQSVFEAYRRARPMFARVSYSCASRTRVVPGAYRRTGTVARLGDHRV